MDDSENGVERLPEYLVVCCWRSIKEISLLFGYMSQHLPITCSADQDGVLNLDQVSAGVCFTHDQHIHTQTHLHFSFMFVLISLDVLLLVHILCVFLVLVQIFYDASPHDVNVVFCLLVFPQLFDCVSSLCCSVEECKYSLTIV